METLLTLTAVGAFSGALLGLVGGAADAMIIPLLVLFHIFKNTKKAVGTSLLMLTGPVTGLAAYQYYRAGEVNVGYALYLGLIYLLAAAVTANIGIRMNEKILRKGTAAFVVAAGVAMWFDRSSEPKP